MKYDNVVVHFYPSSPYIVKACVNLRAGSKIKLSAVLKDREAVERFLGRLYSDLPRKIIIHK